MSWIDTNGVEHDDFIEAGDVKDSIVNGFDIEEYISEATQEIIDLAERLGVRDTSSIETNPLHYKIKRYGICYLIMRICQDKSLVNNVEMIEAEKYIIKYNMYLKELERVQKQISYEMFTGNIDEIRDRSAVSSTLYRG